MALNAPHPATASSPPADCILLERGRNDDHRRQPDPIGPVSPLSTNPRAIPPNPDAPHVLVMDDNPEILDLLGQLLGDEAYRVTLASWTLEPDMIIQLGPDVIITDAIFNLQTGGLHFIKHLRHHPGTRHIPVICCTAMRPAPLELGEFDVAVIPKPFDLDTIVDTVAARCRRSSRRQDLIRE